MAFRRGRQVWRALGGDWRARAIQNRSAAPWRLLVHVLLLRFRKHQARRHSLDENFNAQLNAEMYVGELRETVTVSAATPARLSSSPPMAQVADTHSEHGWAPRQIRVGSDVL